MTVEEQTRPNYDFPTAVTFLLIGLAVGSVLARLFSPLASSSDAASLRRGSRML